MLDVGCWILDVLPYQAVAFGLSWPYRAPIPASHRFPISRMCGIRVLPCRLLVDVHAPTRRFIDVEVAVPDRGTSGKHLLRCLVESKTFLNSEIMNGQVQVDVRRVADGRKVGRPVPGGTHVEPFGERRDLARGGKPSGLRE